MSENIPLDIQLEIIKKVSDVNSLIQFRSVSKPWKSFIDSSDFINGYGARYTQPHSCMLIYNTHNHEDDNIDSSELKYISLVEEDDNESFKVQRQEFAPFVMSPLLKRYFPPYVVGACHGLVCFCCYNIDNYTQNMLVIWNPSIHKSFGILVPRYDHQIQTVYGFGVCPVTSDPTIVKIVSLVNNLYHVEVFTLSLGVWNVIPSANLPRQSITLNMPTQAVVIDRFIYWDACDRTIDDDGNNTVSNIVLSFDLITKEFKVVDLPDSLRNGLFTSSFASVSKLRGSLVVSRYILNEGAWGVWVMEHDSSFTKLFSFGTLHSKILGFKKNGELIFETSGEDDLYRTGTLYVYDPSSQQIKNLGISGIRGSFFMDSYKQSLLLLDHSEFHIYCDDN